MKQVKRPGEPQLELITVKRQTLNLSRHLVEFSRQDADGATDPANVQRRLRFEEKPRHGPPVFAALCCRMRRMVARLPGNH